MTQKQLKRMKGETASEPINGSRELKNAVLKAISFNPNDCYADAVSMRAALEAAKDGGRDTTAYNEIPQAQNGIHEYVDFQDEKTVAVTPEVTVEERTSVSETDGENKKSAGKLQKKTILTASLAAIVAISVGIGAFAFNKKSDNTTMNATDTAISEADGEEINNADANASDTVSDKENMDYDEQIDSKTGYEILDDGKTYINYDLGIKITAPTTDDVYNRIGYDGGFSAREDENVTINDESLHLQRHIKLWKMPVYNDENQFITELKKEISERTTGTINFLGKECEVVWWIEVFNYEVVPEYPFISNNLGVPIKVGNELYVISVEYQTVDEENLNLPVEYLNRYVTSISGY